MTPEAAQLRGILAEAVERLANLLTWLQLALALSEREGQRPEEGGPR